MNNPCETIIENFKNLEDPRINRTKRHKLEDIMTIAICSILCVGDDYTDMEDFGKAKEEWLSTFLELPFGIPSHDTFNRVFRALDPEEFEKCFVSWVNTLRETISAEIIAIDGKTVRRSFDKVKDLSPIHVVSAWARDNELSLGQVVVDDKSNEITAIPKLLNLLNLEGCIVTIDAMGCQKSIASDVIEQNADYVFNLKKNHKNMHKEVESFFNKYWSDGFANLKYKYYETTDKNHGRCDLRRYWITSDISDLELTEDWKGLKSIGMVERVRVTREKTEREVHFYLTSLDSNAEQFAKAVRGHWSVENSLHWTLDLTFREDESRARRDYGAQNLATLRKIAINLIKTNKTSKRSIKAKRRIAALNDNFLLEILLGKKLLN